MKKVIIPVVAVAATLALGGIAVGAGGKNDEPKAIIQTAVTLSFDSDPYDPYNPYYEQSGTFSGTVTGSGGTEAEHSKCERRRNVAIKNAATKEIVGYDVTNQAGQFSVDTLGPYVEAGDYFAKAQKKRKVRAKIKCKGGKSNVVSVPDGGGSTK